MTNFEISFIYNSKNYNASISKEIGYRITYFASIHQPHDLNISNPVPFVAQRGAEMLGWIKIHDYPDLTGVIASAITKYCHENGIALFKA